MPPSRADRLRDCGAQAMDLSAADAGRRAGGRRTDGAHTLSHEVSPGSMIDRSSSARPVDEPGTTLYGQRDEPGYASDAVDQWAGGTVIGDRLALFIPVQPGRAVAARYCAGI